MGPSKPLNQFSRPNTHYYRLKHYDKRFCALVISVVWHAVLRILHYTTSMLHFFPPGAHEPPEKHTDVTDFQTRIPLT